jgi:osmotically-inducible protein OsmY
MRDAARGAALPAAVVGVALLLGLPAATAAQSPQAPTPNERAASDVALRARVEDAIARAADIPADSVTVEVRGGIVTITGSVLCAGCGGNATPAGAGTVQQSLGAVVRAVPGVGHVVFRLRYRPN